ncbi:hypothetical protein P2G88_08400 [Aliiglaciecola sp. CAU 1673]|uniref:hypothetical protein n=1 Tax=Aliiglaciecola sp. CAU 1673 TaxID=3032595 RepID=UPI0023DCC440|nr:hypothetical protein [Aliiglaciecola sp. CAU 1673]MDF2178269.1 hypothetical protein [Aliiglaciecola sp. CAU 1673]
MTNNHNSQSEKVELEHGAAKQFMRWYERNTGEKIRHIWHNEPRKPDVSCYLMDERLDLEIAHLYGSEKEAMKILGRELDEKTRKELKALEKYTEPHERLLNALNRILANKSVKQYATKRVWLVIRNAHPAWSAEEIQSLQHCIDVPKQHPFEQIWMVGDMQGQSGIVQLFP